MINQLRLEIHPRQLNKRDVCNTIRQCIILHTLRRKFKRKKIGGVYRKDIAGTIRQIFTDAVRQAGLRVPNALPPYTIDLVDCYRYFFKKRLEELHSDRQRRRQLQRMRLISEEVRTSLATHMANKIQKKWLKRTSQPNNRKISPDWNVVQWGSWWNRQVRKVNQVDPQARSRVLEILDAGVDVPMAAEEIQEPQANILRVVGGNINSLRKHGVELLEDTQSHPDVYALQELKTNKKFKLLGGVKWRLIQFPRNNSGGGTGFLVRPGLQVERLRHLWYRHSAFGAEVCWIRIQLGSDLWMYIGSVYVPPGRPANEIAAFIQFIVNQLHDFRALGDCAGVLLTGDFNSSWYDSAQLEQHDLKGQSANYTTPGKRWRDALSAVPGFPVVQVLNDASMEFTHMHKKADGSIAKTLIDYAVWFGNCNDITSFRTLDSSLTDHRMLEVSMRTDLPRLAKPPPRICWRRIVDGSRSNADESYSDLFAQYMDRLYKGELEDHDIPTSYAEFIAGLQEGLRTTCGELQPTRNMRGSQCKWWCSKLTKITRKRKKVRRRIYRLKTRGVTSEALTAKNRELKKELKDALYSCQRKYWIKQRRAWSMKNESIVSMFRIIRSVHKKSREISHSRTELQAAWEPIFSAIPPPECHADVHAEENTERAEELEAARNGPLLPGANRITVDEFNEGCKHLHTRKAAGEDGITNEILCRLPELCKQHLISIYNSVLNGEEIPQDWLTSLVVMIAKEDVPGPTDYRPISLLACTVKLFENILYRRLVGIFKDNGMAFEFDSGGFHQWRGCPETLWRYRMLDDWLTKVGEMGAAIFLDIAKAYDTVPIPNLIKKMRTRFPFIPEYIVMFAQRWLTRHVHRILMGDEMDTLDLETLRGLFQGSVLAPFFFNIFVDDFFELLRNGVSREAEGNSPAIHLEAVKGIQFSATPSIGSGLDTENLDLNVDRVARADGGDVGYPEPGGFGVPLTAYGARARPKRRDWPRNVRKIQFDTRALGYADDLVAMASGTTDEIQADLSRVLLLCEFWGKENGMKWSPSKCKFMRFGRISEAVDLTLDLLGNTLEHVDEFNYLGVYVGERRLRYLRQDKRFAQIKAEFLDPPYTMFQARYGCNLRVGLHIVCAQVIPKLMYGARMYPLSVEAEKIWMRVCRKTLCCYRTDSAISVRKFLGCRPLRDLVSMYTVRFVFKLALGGALNLIPLRRLMMATLFDVDDTPSRNSWVHHARTQIEHAVRKGWLFPPARQADNGVDWVSIRGLLLSCKDTSTEREAMDERYRRSKQHGHPCMLYCPEKANFTFRFYRGHFNPRDVEANRGGFHGNCRFCQDHNGDTPSHLAVCPDGRIQTIMSEGFETLVLNNYDRSFEAQFVRLVQEPGIAVSQGRWSSHTEILWRTICHTHLRLWKCRKKMFYAGAAGAPDEDDDDEDGNDPEEDMGNDDEGEDGAEAEEDVGIDDAEEDVEEDNNDAAQGGWGIVDAEEDVEEEINDAAQGGWDIDDAEEDVEEENNDAAQSGFDNEADMVDGEAIYNEADVFAWFDMLQ